MNVNVIEMICQIIAILLVPTILTLALVAWPLEVMKNTYKDLYENAIHGEKRWQDMYYAKWNKESENL